jgi:DNA-binding NarL/FixJ family response regulator
MVAEDFPELNQIYRNILDHEPDITIIAAVTSGKELLEAVDIQQPDVILMDIEMESPTAGIDYCRRIRSRYPYTKIVMLSCHEEDYRIISAFEAGAVDYILKTDSISDIIKAIKKAYTCESPIHSYAADTLRRQIQTMGKYKEELQEFTRAFMQLTPAEVGVLQLLLRGNKQKDICEIKHIAIMTVKSHVNRILKKFTVKRTSDVLELIYSLNVEKFVEQSRSV